MPKLMIVPKRLSLSNNHLFHIPYRFAECSHLRYLNIRANNFREFPKGVSTGNVSTLFSFLLTHTPGIQVAVVRNS